MHWRRKWQPIPVFLPWESQGRGSLVGCCLWGSTESDTTDGLAAAGAETAQRTGLSKQTDSHEKSFPITSLANVKKTYNQEAQVKQGGYRPFSAVTQVTSCQAGCTWLRLCKEPLCDICVCINDTKEGHFAVTHYHFISRWLYSLCDIFQEATVHCKFLDSRFV